MRSGRTRGECSILSGVVIMNTLPDLNAWLKAAAVVHSIQALGSSKQRTTREVFERQLLQLIFEAVPADRGAVLLTEAGAELGSVSGWDRASSATEDIPVSENIVQRVLTQAAPVMESEPSENGQARSIIAVPMMASRNVLGVVYLDSKDPAVGYSDSHLQLVTAIAGIAAMALDNARHVEQLEDENQRLQEEINVRHDLVGESPSMRAVYRFLSRVAPANSTVLIRGESGTGKELVARAIHRNSPRDGKPFVAINCAALTETLLESELFGHEKGAFTGALAQKKGKLEIAAGGTVFLDEIGEVAPAIQSKLLRVLQEREFERVGGTRSIHVDIRVVAATNRDLAESMRRGLFRQDLYYRLNVISFAMPSLRERQDDIPLLAHHFVSKHSERCNRRVGGISRQALACLMNYSWPGNVRELENAIERAIVLGTTDEVLPEDLPEGLLETESLPNVRVAKYHEAVFEAKKQLILNATQQAKGNQAEAARLLGLNPTYLSRLMRNMNLRVNIEKEAP